MPVAWADGLRADLQTLLDQQQLAGAIVATQEGEQGQVLALGQFNTATRQPLRSEHRVQVGSVTKTVLSLAVLRLVSQGRLSLDTPLTQLLPQVQLDSRWAARSPVRVRHLLDMTAGLPDVQLWHLFNTRHRFDQPLLLALRAELGPIRLRSEPGLQFSYSNLSFLLAGMVIEAVTQERYEAWAERELLRPLGMQDSSLAARSQLDDPLLAWGHQEDGQPIADGPNAVRPAANFTTTGADMQRLMRFLLGDGRLAGQAFVRADLLADMGRARTTSAARAGLQTGYGLGLFTRDRHGAVNLCHGGSSAGWRAMLCINRAAQRGFFIALNTDREGTAYTQFDERLVRHLGLAKPAPTGTLPAARAGDASWSGLYVPAPGRLQALALPDRLLSFWMLDLQPGQASLREGLFAPPRALLPAGDGLYRQADRQQATLALLRDADGAYRVGGGYLTLRRVSLWQQGLLWAAAVVGSLGLLALLPLALLRLWQQGPGVVLRQVPAAPGLLLLAAAAAGWGLQGWQRLGEPSQQAVALAVASLLFLLACAAQVGQAWRRKQAFGAEGLVGLALLFLCGLLAAYGWLPLLTWRL